MLNSVDLMYGTPNIDLKRLLLATSIFLTMVL
jgi:hypothetical protein